jgi:hypothetical protein
MYKQTVIKCKLNKIIKDPDKIDIIDDCVERIDNLVCHTYQFIRLWILHEFYTTKKITPISVVDVKVIFKLFTKTKLTTDNNIPIAFKVNGALYKKYYEFYVGHFKSLMEDVKISEDGSKIINDNKISGKNLSHILNNSATEIMTSITNHIQLNFNIFLRRFINQCFSRLKNKCLEDKKKYIKNCNSGELFNSIIKDIDKNIKHIKDIFIENKNNNLEGIYLEFYNWCKEKILPTIESNMDYQIHIRKYPYEYLSSFIKMNEYLETNKLKQFQILPLRNTYIKKNIHLDTCALVDLFLTNADKYYKDIVNLKDNVWDQIFKMDNKIFKSKKNKFDYRISTNGYSCSLLFVSNNDVTRKEDNKKKKIDASKKKRQTNKQLTTEEIIKQQTIDKNKKQEEILNKKLQRTEESKKKQAEYKLLSKEAKKELADKRKNKIKEMSIEEFKNSNKLEFPYLDELPDKLLEHIKDKNKIYIDPGKRDLFKMLGDNGKYFTYSGKQRRKELKQLKYRKQIEKYKKSQKIDVYETKLGLLNPKTVRFNKFKNYIKKYMNIRKIIKEKYSSGILEKLNWFSYINKKRSEDRLLDKMKKVYNDHKIIIIGDWSIGKQMRNFISTPMISLKRKLKEQYEVYNLDEYKTSKLSCKTGEECDKLYLPRRKYELKNISDIRQKRERLRYRKGKEIEKEKLNILEEIKSTKMYSILTYKMENNRKGCINRDKNSVQNMRNISTSILNGLGIPEKFRRGKSIGNKEEEKKKRMLERERKKKEKMLEKKKIKQEKMLEKEKIKQAKNLSKSLISTNNGVKKSKAVNRW